MSSRCKACFGLYRRRTWEKRNAEKSKEYNRAWYAKNPEKVRLYRLKEFGLTKEDYARLLLSQAGRCAICSGVEESKSLAVDHCHTTGRVRGLLCSRCNTALGSMRDSPETLRRAAAYLEGIL